MDEATRRAQLLKMKRVATGLLVVALLVFIVARMFEPAYPWLGYVRATAEASLVGGLADWFAVTALFRRPLGLPIPHTAIIPTQKDRIGRVLGGFVEKHFLSREILSAKLTGLRVSERAARWVVRPENSARVATQLAAAVAKAVEALPEAEVTELIRRGAVARLQSVRVAPILGNMLSVVAADDRHQELLDEAIGLVTRAVAENRDTLRESFREGSPWWLPGVVDEALYRRIMTALDMLLADVRANPAHPLRRRFDEVTRDFIERLKHSPDVIARAEALKRDVLDDALMDALSNSLWARVRQAAARYGGEPDPALLEPLQRGLVTLAESLLANQILLSELDAFLAAQVSALLEDHRQEVGALIADTVKAWPPGLASERLELAVGRDLQFIRLNGTLVGGLAGLIIYTCMQLW
ncbi:MAG TPA: DUF445 family protein [Gemmatimonadales bacterium]|nr:DUF445 family protein [Gemmatimonadales bacterium]